MPREVRQRDEAHLVTGGFTVASIGNGSGLPRPVAGRSRSVALRAGGMAAALALAFVAMALTSGNELPPLGARPSPEPPGGRRVFYLSLDRVVPFSLGSKAGVAEARATARSVRDSLSRFYDAAFFDPVGWAEGVPASAWEAFTAAAAESGRRDVAALTLGEVAQSVRSLEDSASSLSIRVLIDPSGHAQAAVAFVELRAEGLLADGGMVEVDHRARFLLRPAGERWLVTAYPAARTEIDTIPPEASPSPEPSSSVTAEPSG